MLRNPIKFSCDQPNQRSFFWLNTGLKIHNIRTQLSFLRLLNIELSQTLLSLTILNQGTTQSFSQEELLDLRYKGYTSQVGEAWLLIVH